MVSVNKIIAPITNSAKNLYNKVPSVSVAKNNVINNVIYVGEKWTSPQQRVVMGATAILIQPFIDANNDKVDDETRRVSVARTLAKIIVGTATGFAVRYLCIKGVQYTSKPLNKIPQNASKLSKKIQSLLTPDRTIKITDKAMEQYQFALGTYLSLGVMLFTNFLVDAPWTRKLTNLFLKVDEQMRGGKKE